jgi:hypothetical protein
MDQLPLVGVSPCHGPWPGQRYLGFMFLANMGKVGFDTFKPWITALEYITVRLFFLAESLSCEIDHMFMNMLGVGVHFDEWE